jgi:DNA end-binding protein Ku
MPPRAIWSGSISFGLVNVPVRMYSAISETDLRFHLIHEPDGGRIGYQKICKEEGEPVPEDEIVKGFEFKEDEFVVLTDEDFEAAKAEGVKSIEISDFVPYDEIDPIFFEKTYYLGPQSGGEKVYALLREAMEKTGLAGIAKFVMRDRQHLGCLRVREGTLTLEKMFFHDEVRPIDEIAPRNSKVSKSELDMATSLIEQFTGTFEHEKYEDTYR